MKNGEQCRVLICDDHGVVRAGLKMLVDMTNDLTVVGEAGDFDEAEAKVRELQPDIVTVDLSMPKGSAFEFLGKIKSLSPETRSVVLTMHDEEAYFRRAIAAGASAYVLKKSADNDFLSAIRAAASGRFFASVDFVSAATGAATSETSQFTGLEDLSKRELEVLHLLALGLTNQNIADRMFLSVKTIESYRSRLLRKLSLKTRADIIAFALKSGILEFGV